MKNLHSIRQTSFAFYLIRFTVMLSLIFLCLGVCHSEPNNKASGKADSIEKAHKADSIKKAIDKAASQANAIKCDTCKIDHEKAVTANNIFVGCVIATCLVCLIVCGLLIYFCGNCPKNGKHALGLPGGSVRAIIAVLIIIFYALLSIIFSVFGGTSPSPLCVDAAKTLGILVVAVSSFYFGSKTAEQGSRTATDNLTAILNSTVAGPATPAPVSIIQEAITANKTNWMAVYACSNILLGKKATQDTTNNLDCIVFVVKNKGTVPPDAKPIPSVITYNSQGKDYNIPTDVR